MLRIHEILLWIQIRIRGSIALINGPATDADPDPAIFVSDLHNSQQTHFFGRLLFEGTFTSFFKNKKIIKESQNSRNQCFSYYFCLMIEGLGSGSGSVTNGSGSGRPINIWILRIRIGIRIRNTVTNSRKSRHFRR
jgi:hypothetical protein